MPMNDEVRKAMDSLDQSLEGAHQPTERNWIAASGELTRLYTIADSIDPLVVRLHDVTTQLEAANALLRGMRDGAFNIGGWADGIDEYFDAHLSEPRT